MVKVSGNDNVKITFRAYKFSLKLHSATCQKWIDLRRTKAKMITGLPSFTGPWGPPPF